MIFTTLQTFFQEHPKAAVACSGGVDSAFLLWSAKQYGCDVHAYYASSVFQPAFALADARRLAAELSVPMAVIDIEILSVQGVAENGPDRCYHCKRALLLQLWEAARQDGHTLLLDGTNASDHADDRPGMRALRELAVRSPLQECGLTKDDVRNGSRAAGLFTWDKPAYSCLATRIPENTPITRTMLQTVESAENALFQMGFSDFRIRLMEGAARLQVTENQMAQAVAERAAITAALRPFFPVVLLDLEPRPKTT